MDDYQDDLQKLIRAYKTKGIKITEDEAENIWSDYSESLCATWLMMSDDLDNLFEITKPYWNEM